MIDFIKMELGGVGSNYLMLIPWLDFKTSLSEQTGELGNKLEAEWHQMKIIVYRSGRIFLQGSLHMAFNSICGCYAPNQRTDQERAKGFNGNQFNYTQLRYVLHYFSTYLGFSLNKAVIRNLEFGLNIVHPFDTKLILTNLIKHKGKPFLNPKQYFYVAEHSQYSVKCYDKGFQYGLGEQLLRVEVKCVKMEGLNVQGIVTAIDLLDKANLSVLAGLLDKRWNEVFLYDYTIRTKELQKNDNERVLKFQSPNFWRNELPANRQDRHKRRYKKIESEHSDRVKQVIGEQMTKIWGGLNRNCVTLDRLSENNKNLAQCVIPDHSVIQSSLTHPINETRTNGAIT